MNSCHSQNHGLGKVKGTKVVKAFGPSDAYYGSWPLEGQWGDGG